MENKNGGRRNQNEKKERTHAPKQPDRHRYRGAGRYGVSCMYGIVVYYSYLNFIGRKGIYHISYLINVFVFVLNGYVIVSSLFGVTWI